MKKKYNLLIAIIFSLAIFITALSNMNLTAYADSTIGKPYLTFSNITSSSITINWEDVDSGIYYDVYGCSSQSGIDYVTRLTRLGGSATSTYSYTHSGLLSNTTYYYKVVACNGRGGSTSSNIYSKSTSMDSSSTTNNTTTNTIEAPTLTFSNITSSSITINWSKSLGGTYYELYGCSSQSGVDSMLLTSFGGGTGNYSYTYSGLYSNTTYYFKVKACKSGGGSATSSMYSITTSKNTIEAPTLTFSNITSSSITINWSKSLGGTYYELYGCSSQSGVDSMLLTSFGGGTGNYSYTYSGLYSNTTYYFKVKACKSGGGSATSSMYSITTSKKTIEAPTLTFSNITSSSITVNWKGTTSGTYYEIYGCSSQSGIDYTDRLAKLEGNSTYSYTHSGLYSNMTYYYKVVAYNSSGDIVSSQIYSKKTEIAVEAPEFNFSDITDSSITINWSATNAISYEVFGCSSESGLIHNSLCKLDGGKTTYSYTDTSLFSNTTYYYMIKAYDKYGDYDLSLVCTAKTGSLIIYDKLTMSFSNITDSSITINWDSTVGNCFELYSCTEDGKLEDTCLYYNGGHREYSYTHTNLDRNTTYYYILKANAGLGRNYISLVYSAQTIEPVEAPSLKLSNKTDSSITVDWNATDAIRYELYGSASESLLNYSLICTLDGQTKYSYVHNKLFNNTTYYYMVKAYDEYGNYALTPIVSKKTGTLTTSSELSLSFSDVIDSSITVAWNKLDSDDYGYYELYSCTADGILEDTPLYVRGGDSEYKHVHTGLLRNTSYYYVVKAYDSKRNALVSQVFEQKTKDIDTVPSLTFSDIDATSITINWEKTSNGVYYELYNCASDGTIKGDYIYKMGGSNTYSFTHTNLIPDTVYYYKLIEYYSDGGSLKSLESKTYVEATLGGTIRWFNYDANGGANAPIMQGIYDKGDITISEQIPTRLGYNFKGWQVSGTDKIYYPGDVITFVTSDANLVAIWEETQLYTDDYIDVSQYERNYPYYIEGTDYKADRVCINSEVNGLHYFRICSSTEEVTVTLKFPVDKNVFVTLTAFPEHKYDKSYTAEEFSETQGITINHLSRKTEIGDEYRTVTYTYSTDYIYNGDRYYDYGLCINTSDSVTYDCNVRYTYPEAVEVSNGGLWVSDWHKNEASMTGGEVIENNYVVNNISHPYTAQQMCMANYWYLTAEQKEQWQKISNYIYNEDLLLMCKLVAAENFTLELVDVFSSFISDEIMLVTFDLYDTKFINTLNKMFPEVSIEQQIALLIADYIDFSEEDFLDMYGEDIRIRCALFIDQMSSLSYNPIDIINEIEQDLYDASINGTLPSKLTELSTAIDNNNIFSIYARKIYDEESYEDYVIEYIKILRDSLVEGLFSAATLSAVNQIVIIHKVFSAIYDLEQAINWCNTASRIRDSIDEYCSNTTGGIKTTALTAKYYIEYNQSVAWAVQGPAPLEICEWEGTIPRHIHYDIIGDVVAFEEI